MNSKSNSSNGSQVKSGSIRPSRRLARPTNHRKEPRKGCDQPCKGCEQPRLFRGQGFAGNMLQLFGHRWENLLTATTISPGLGLVGHRWENLLTATTISPGPSKFHAPAFNLSPYVASLPSGVYHLKQACRIWRVLNVGLVRDLVDIYSTCN